MLYNCMCKTCLFLDACRRGDSHCVQSLITNNQDNISQGLYQACKYGNVDVVHFLVSLHNAIPTSIDLYIACELNREEVIKYLAQDRALHTHLSYEHTALILNYGIKCENKCVSSLTHRKRKVAKVMDKISLAFPLFDLNIINIMTDYVEYAIK